ncbi:P-loop containing nucleoside triphosphate hydrolase protein [Ilyonectria robusta]|uniref:P-loop containing nucleoside triphosphate hydrolase protein n=1 Tax=Ilyonectria robusta TaxID=1079257 RepID=UPI001E8E1B37|nr:P-loop containing nucleoside triphosphate hydrolase protein [Ilyonectria robusta]KAH8694581.1 P-loop containing nucleoside triphosphate hydrolase protein [Ilyonectria robusta]
MEFQSTNPSFRVSWLLGLQPYQHIPTTPPWAKQYETNDPNFSVRFIIGIVPSKRSRRSRKPRTRRTVKQPVKAEEDDLGIDPFGLRRLFDDLSEEEVKEAEEAEQLPVDGEPEILAEAGFLELCSKMEQLLDDIESSQQDSDDSDNESIDGLDPEDCDDESPSRIEWLRQKTVEKAENKYLDRLMSLPGLEEAKAFFLHAKAKIQAATRRETDLKKENFDAVFMGNQGTGKTMLANLYAKFLASMGVVKAVGAIDGISKFSAYNMSKTSTLSSIHSSCITTGGCIAIIDHAHLLDHDDCNLWNFYVRSLDLPGKIVIIFAGNGDWGLSDQLGYSAQVSNHFPVLKLPNYNKDQLQTVFHGMMRRWFNKKMEVEGGYDGPIMKILMRRITQGINEKMFGNIWPVRKAFLEACRRQVERFRLARKDGNYLEDYMMTREDLLGNKPSLGPDNSPAWKELQELVGLDAVKESILSVVNQVNQNHIREMRGDEPLNVSANRVFLGAPGTGKTTVARLYGKILADFGILSKGEVFVKTPTDLLDRYIGGSENNTKEALREAKGSVLIIDDAHMLDPGRSSNSHSKNGDFRGGIIDTIVAEVAGTPGEDRCVILCGYPDQMKEMYGNCNPGLARRFPLDSAFVFENFDEESLGKILDLKLNKEKLIATDKAREVAMEVLKRSAVRPNFGNGGEVDNLISKAIMARLRRVSKDKKPDEDLDVFPIEPQDFDADYDRLTRAVANTRALFDGFVGYEEIISKFESYQYMVQGMRLRNVDPRPYVPFTYVFKGLPGTGKTTTARKLGQIFYDMGLLSAPDVIEVSASQLIGEYCGQTGPKTKRLLESALGKVLFIDEAYRLAGHAGSFAEEAVSELVDAVTKPQFARKLIIVLAGYEEDMDRLLRSNQGMRSRFATEFTFRPLRAEQCVEQLRAVVERVGITIQSTREMDTMTRTSLMTLLNRLSNEKGWASGRSVETLGERLIGHIFKECAMKGYTGKDLSVTGKELVTILGQASGHGGAGAKKWGGQGPMGARQVMTLRDLEGYE